MTFNATPGFLSADDCRLADLIDLVSQKTDPADYPYAQAVEQNVLIYDGVRLRTELSRPAGRRRVESELARALSDGLPLSVTPLTPSENGWPAPGRHHPVRMRRTAVTGLGPAARAGNRRSA